jgi:hypothetical protein
LSQRQAGETCEWCGAGDEVLVRFPGQGLLCADRTACLRRGRAKKGQAMMRLTYARLLLALAAVLALLGANHPDGDHRYSRSCEECGSDAVVCPWCWCCGDCCGGCS